MEAASSSSGAMPADASSSKVSRQGSNKITYKISLLAQEHCADLIKDFNLCAKGRSVSMMWACRDAYNKSQDCVHMFVNDKNIEMVKRRWIDAGRPSAPDWDVLLAGIGPTK